MLTSNKTWPILILLFFGWLNNFGQSASDNFEKLNEIEPDSSFENIYIKKLNSTAESSSFLIWVKDTVKPHFHKAHTEMVYVLHGKGIFYLADEKMVMQTGDFVTIKPNTVHAFKTTSAETVKVLSIQAPEFFGKDRFFID